MNNKEKILVLALGREITIYDIGKKLSSEKSVSWMGQFYTVKKELLEEGLIVEVAGEGRSKPVKANIAKYLDNILGKIENEKTFRKMNELLFEEFAPKVVDFLVEKKLLDKECELSYPFAVFLLIRYLITVGNYFPEPKSKGIVSKFQSFITDFKDNEKQRLKFPEKTEENFRLMVGMISPTLFKDVFEEFVAVVFYSFVLFRELFDYLVDAGHDKYTEKERNEIVEFLRGMYEKKQKRIEKDYLESLPSLEEEEQELRAQAEEEIKRQKKVN